jgi:hypothetical protein
MVAHQQQILNDSFAAANTVRKARPEEHMRRISHIPARGLGIQVPFRRLNARGRTSDKPHREITAMTHWGKQIN